MIRKICHIGNSQGISIPKDILKKLNLTTGVEVEVTLDEGTNRIIIEPSISSTTYKPIDAEFATQVKEFIDQYRPALKSLAKK